MPIDAQSLNNPPQNPNAASAQEAKPGISRESFQEATRGVNFSPSVNVNTNRGG